MFSRDNPCACGMPNKCTLEMSRERCNIQRQNVDEFQILWRGLSLYLEEERLDVVEVFMLASDCGVKRTFSTSFGSGHPFDDSMVLVFTFQTQKSLSDVAQRTTSLTPISASVAWKQLWMLWPIVSRRLQLKKIRSGFDAISFSRGNVVVVAMGTDLEDLAFNHPGVLLRDPWYSSFYASGMF